MLLCKRKLGANSLCTSNIHDMLMQFHVMVLQCLSNSSFIDQPAHAMSLPAKEHVSFAGLSAVAIAPIVEVPDNISDEEKTRCLRYIATLRTACN